MGWLSRKWKRSARNISGKITGQGRLIQKACGFKQSEEGRITALEADDASNETRPDSRRRRKCQRVRHAKPDFRRAVARRPGFAKLIHRHELKIDPVIRQQTQAAVARVLDGHRALRTQEHFKTQYSGTSDRALHLAPVGVFDAARVEHRRQLRPDIGEAIAASRALDLFEEPCQPVGCPGQTGHRHLLASLCQLNEQTIVHDISAPAVQFRVCQCIRMEMGRQLAQSDCLQAFRGDRIARGKKRCSAAQET